MIIKKENQLVIRDSKRGKYIGLFIGLVMILLMCLSTGLEPIISWLILIPLLFIWGVFWFIIKTYNHEIILTESKIERKYSDNRIQEFKYSKVTGLARFFMLNRLPEWYSAIIIDNHIYDLPTQRDIFCGFNDKVELSALCKFLEKYFDIEQIVPPDDELESLVGYHIKENKCIWFSKLSYKKLNNEKKI